MVVYVSMPVTEHHAAAETETEARENERQENQNDRQVVAERGTKIVSDLRLLALAKKRIHRLHVTYERHHQLKVLLPPLLVSCVLCVVARRNRLLPPRTLRASAIVFGGKHHRNTRRTNRKH